MLKFNRLSSSPLSFVFLLLVIQERIQSASLGMGHSLAKSQRKSVTEILDSEGASDILNQGSALCQFIERPCSGIFSSWNLSRIRNNS